MPSPFRVHIHLGAHKTATTFLQNWLARHQAFLRGHQIAYLPLSTLRRQFTPCFWQLVGGKAASPPDLVKKLRGIINADIEASGFDLQATKLLVLSEENLLGSLAPLSQKGVLYPALAGRMGHLATVFGDCDVQAFMSIRNFREFYPSAYAETLRHGAIKPFAEYLNRLDLSGNSWLAVIDAVESALGPAKLWPYELFRANAHDVLSALLLMPITADMIGIGDVARPSLTRKGLEVAMLCHNKLSVPEMKRLVNILAEKMVFDPPDGRITIDDSVLGDQLDAQYRHELERLAQRFIVNAPAVSGTNPEQHTLRAGSMSL